MGVTHECNNEVSPSHLDKTHHDSRLFVCLCNLRVKTWVVKPTRMKYNNRIPQFLRIFKIKHVKKGVERPWFCIWLLDAFISDLLPTQLPSSGKKIFATLLHFATRFIHSVSLDRSTPNTHFLFFSEYSSAKVRSMRYWVNMNTWWPRNKHYNIQRRPHELDIQRGLCYAGGTLECCQSTATLELVRKDYRSQTAFSPHCDG